MKFAHPAVQIKGHKTHRGHEGEPLAQGFLHFRGKKFIDWSEGDWGGPFRVHVLDRSLVSEFATLARQQLTGRYNYLDELYAPELMSEDELVDEYVERLAGEFGEMRHYEKDSKGGAVILFRRKETPIGSYIAMKTPYTAANVAQLRAKYPDITEIINETLNQPYLGDDAVKAAERAEWIKRMQRQCRTKTVFGIKQDGSADPKYLQIAQPYYPAMAAQLRAKYGDQLVEIVNERFL